jgi:hypothetical protein
MAGRGFAPKETGRRGHDPLVRGDWQAVPAVGWQHGDVPAPPRPLSKAAIETWHAWFGSWFAAHWTPEDLPVLRMVIKLYARTLSGTATGSERSEFRQLADSYGITPKGQQDRRWKRPEAAPAATPEMTPTPYAHLSVVNE